MLLVKLCVPVHACVFLYISNKYSKSIHVMKIYSLIKILVKCHKNKAPLTTLDS